MEEVQTFHPSSNFVPGTIADFLKELLSIPDPGDRASEIDVFLTRLQEELRKINGFKYELPLCVILMNEGNNDLYAKYPFCFRLKTRICGGENNSLKYF